MEWSRRLPLLACILCLCFLGKIDAVIHSGSKSFVKNYKHLGPDFTIHAVSLTQKGYIQFLRYITEVPTLTEYTFCIWVRSNNLTHNHPLLSYSKHEEERLIRVWVSEYGADLNLEILEQPIVKIPVNMVENHWYHVCQSWSSYQASWSLFLNGKLTSSGFVPKLKDVPIAGGGDIVVGQEYTDFDKGLDDGIEGQIFGFNFVLSSASTSSKHPGNLIKFGNYPLRRNFNDRGWSSKPLNIYHPSAAQFNFAQGGRKRLFQESGGVVLLRPLDYFDLHPIRKPKGLVTFGRNSFHDVPGFFEPEVLASPFPLLGKAYVTNTNFGRQTGERRIVTNDIGENPKTLGLLLVEMSFDCGLKKGAPLSGKRVLINWTKSPVRVFGGAILHSILPFCRKLDV